MRRSVQSSLVLAGALLVGVLVGGEPISGQPKGDGYAKLVALFEEWRAFQRPKVVDGVPDYTARAMKAQQGGCRRFSGG